jgi:hypothetical protein
MIERHHIEGRPAQSIAENLLHAFEEYCAQFPHIRFLARASPVGAPFFIPPYDPPWSAHEPCTEGCARIGP